MVMNSSPADVAAAAVRKAEQRRLKRDAANRRERVRAGREDPGQFLGLAVVIIDGAVFEWSTTVKNELGPLRGAQAGIAGPIKTGGAGKAIAATVAFGVPGAVGALARRGTKPFAYVLFPDGKLFQADITDKSLAGRAQADVLRFNALAEGVQ
jgi:hypothetical protein